MKIEGQGAEIFRFLVRVHKRTNGQMERPSSRGGPLLRKGSPKNIGTPVT